MKTARYILSLSLWLAAFGLSAQTLHMTTGGKKEKIGYADENGEIVIKCKYVIAEEFHDGIAMVSDDGEHYGFIDERGKEVLPIKYDEICPVEYGVRRIRDKDEWGLIDEKGEVLLKAKYTYISRFNCYGKAWVMKGGKLNKEQEYEDGEYGIINLTGKFLIPTDYKYLMEFGSTRYDWSKEGDTFNQSLDRTGKVLSYKATRSPKDTLETECNYVGYSSEGKKLKNQLAGLLDGYGNVLVKEGTYSRIYEPASNMMAFYNLKGKKMSTGFLELGSKRIINIKSGKLKSKHFHNDWSLYIDSTYVNPFHGELGVVRIGQNNAHLIDRYGKQVGQNYRDIWWYNDDKHEGYWLCSDGKTQSMIDEKGNTLVPLGKYTKIVAYDNYDATDLFPVCDLQGICGVIDRHGREVIPFEYETIYRSRYGIFIVKRDGKFGALNAQNQTLVEPIYEGITFNKTAHPKSLWVQKMDRHYYCYDLEKQQMASNGYYDVTVQGDGKYTVCVLSDVELASHKQHALAEFYTPEIKLKDRKQLCVLCNEQGEEVFKAPFPQEPWLIPRIIDAVEKNGDKPISYSQAKSIILHANMMFRHYLFGGARISEDEWDF